jgi:hypothetical protein
MKFTTVDNCNVCGKGPLETIFVSRAMPLTGLYLPGDSDIELPAYDQAFNYCPGCGHGQLRHVISPEVLYDKTYTHRSSQSVISQAGNDFFERFVRKVTGGEKYRAILEIGCNDLYLLEKIQDMGEALIGVDPIWVGNDHQANEKTRILGCFVGDLKDGTKLGVRPDLVLSAHTFEHVPDLIGEMRTVFDLAAENCLFVIEMPCLDTIVRTGRFDQIFHQHIQYLSLSSMVGVIDGLGAEYVDHAFNYGYWGGTLLFAFRKRPSAKAGQNPRFDAPGAAALRTGFEAFKKRLLGIRDMLTERDTTYYGFGAAQMLPVLAHYMETDFGFAEAILDDNEGRIGHRLPHVKCPIMSPSAVGDMSEATIIITALDSTRPIMRRLIELSPRRIITLTNIF